MASVNKTGMLKFTTMALMITIAMVLSYFERFIPIISVPGVKLGLANIVTLIALILFPFRDAFIIVLLRVVLVGFFAGSPISFLYSFTGGMISLIGMKLVLEYLRRWLSIIGISVIGAFLHNTGQALVLAAILKNFSIARSYYPILVLAAAVTGTLTGIIGYQFMKHIEFTPLKKQKHYDM